jgi:1-acyl-sn-glycerol-3-phosphate acyltransferase
MAKKANVRVVPVSLGNLHRWMPPSALLPLAPMKGVYIQIHPPIETAGRTVSEIKKLCFEAVNNGLPEYQQAAIAASSSSSSSSDS